MYANERIETAHHVAHEGLLPIVATSRSADIFKHAHSMVQISAPLHEFNAAYKVIILLDDLHLFCQVWFYSSLNYRQLNEHLRVEYSLKDPYYPADPKPIPLSLQKKLLLPFGVVKNCYEVEVTGYDSTVEDEFRSRMAVPYDSVQKCLEDCSNLMEVGDREFSAGNTQNAVEKYKEAFKAIHILVDGRSRRVLADSFFHDGIESGRFIGQIGTTVRVVLRVKLVARVVASYLKLKEWEEAAFWGMRSVRIMREAIDTEFEGFLTDLIISSEVGLIYARTSIAFRKMEDAKSEELKVYQNEQDVANSERLLEFAKKYLKGQHEPLLKKELDTYGVKEFQWAFTSLKEEESDVDSLAPMNWDFNDALPEGGATTSDKNSE